jgi:hypothetical protein
MRLSIARHVGQNRRFLVLPDARRRGGRDGQWTVHSPITCGIVGCMKALKSKLASQLLADPQASDQLLDFVLGKTARTGVQKSAVTGQFVIRGEDGRPVQVSARVVPKASKAA